jgi:hypothetical protein
VDPIELVDEIKFFAQRAQQDFLGMLADKLREIAQLICPPGSFGEEVAVI